MTDTDPIGELAQAARFARRARPCPACGEHAVVVHGLVRITHRQGCQAIERWIESQAEPDDGDQA